MPGHKHGKSPQREFLIVAFERVGETVLEREFITVHKAQGRHLYGHLKTCNISVRVSEVEVALVVLGKELEVSPSCVSDFFGVEGHVWGLEACLDEHHGLNVHSPISLHEEEWNVIGIFAYKCVLVFKIKAHFFPHFPDNPLHFRLPFF